MSSTKTSSILSTLVFLILLSYGIVTAAHYGLCSQRNKDPECRTFESLGYGIDPRAVSFQSHGHGISSSGLITTVTTTDLTTSPGPLDQIPTPAVSPSDEI